MAGLHMRVLVYLIINILVRLFRDFHASYAALLQHYEDARLAKKAPKNPRKKAEKALDDNKENETKKQPAAKKSAKAGGRQPGIKAFLAKEPCPAESSPEIVIAKPANAVFKKRVAAATSGDEHFIAAAAAATAASYVGRREAIAADSKSNLAEAQMAATELMLSRLSLGVQERREGSEIFSASPIRCSANATVDINDSDIR
jgi:hypothetical protein